MDEQEQKSAWERYIDNEPVNEELAKMREGTADDAPDPEKLFGQGQRHVFEDVERPLTTKERGQLRKVRLLPGYAVLMRLYERSFHLHKKGAIARSQIDPLKNKEAIADEWAYVLAYGRAKDELRLVVEGELQELEKEKRT